MNAHVFLHIPTKVNGQKSRFRSSYAYDRFCEELSAALHSGVTIIEAPYADNILHEHENNLHLVHDIGVMEHIFPHKSESVWRRTIILNCDRANFSKYLSMTPLAGLVDTIAMRAWRLKSKANSWTGLICKDEYFQFCQIENPVTLVKPNPALDLSPHSWHMLSHEHEEFIQLLADYITWLGHDLFRRNDNKNIEILSQGS